MDPTGKWGPGRVELVDARVHQPRAEQRGDGVEHDEQQPERERPPELGDEAAHREVGVGPGLLLDVQDEPVADGRERLDPGEQLGGGREGQLPPAPAHPGPEAGRLRDLRA